MPAAGAGDPVVEKRIFTNRFKVNDKKSGGIKLKDFTAIFALEEKYRCETCRNENCKECACGNAISAFFAVEAAADDLHANLGCPFANNVAEYVACDGCDQNRGADCWKVYYIQKGLGRLTDHPRKGDVFNCLAPLTIEVIRSRSSVTQGDANILINGRLTATFEDKIEIIRDGQPYFGTMIGTWASVKPDSDFIKGLLYHPHDSIYHYSDAVIQAIMAADAPKTRRFTALCDDKCHTPPTRVVVMPNEENSGKEGE